MKASISRLGLLGTSRVIPFSDGLNVIRGEIGTGKSTVLRLIYGLFGGAYRDLIPELDRVQSVEGLVDLGPHSYRISRRPVSTSDALVDIFGDDETTRLPAEVANGANNNTFKQWVQQKLELPQFEVYPSERLDAPPSPVTVSDYFFYSYLRQADLGRDLLGSSDRFRAIKRRAVFAQVWGLVSARHFDLEGQLRSAELRLNDVRGRRQAAEDFFAESPWSNAAALASAVENANVSLAELRREGTSSIRAALLRGYASGVSGLPAPSSVSEDPSLAESLATPSRIEIVRSRILQLDDSVSLIQNAIQHELRAAEELDSLALQLEAQRHRLNKAVAARSYLLDYDFMKCPRCGTGLDADRRRLELGANSVCYLCLQQPQPDRVVSREAMEDEERRISAQILESRSLAEMHRESRTSLETELADKKRDRIELSEELNARTSTYVSDNASDLETRAAAEAKLRAEIDSLRGYQSLHARLEALDLEERELVERVNTLKSSLRVEDRRMSASEANLDVLDDEFATAIAAVNVPHLASGHFVAVDRDPDYLGPVVWGRRFHQLHSPGTKTLVNVAFATSGQRAAIIAQRPLANILLIDGLTGYQGDDATGSERKIRLWRYLLSTAEEYRGRLQIIVADNEVPAFVDPYVRVTLSANERLVPGEPA